MPPAFRNHLVPTGCDTPASSAASSLLSPVAIARQNLICSSRPAAGGRPGEGNGARPDRADRRFRMLIATSNFRVLRRPLESTLNLVDVREVDPPAGEGVHWRLLTTLPVADAAEAFAVADLYRRRWAIEQLFRTLKTKGF